MSGSNLFDFVCETRESCYACTNLFDFLCESFCEPKQTALGPEFLNWKFVLRLYNEFATIEYRFYTRKKLSQRTWHKSLVLKIDYGPRLLHKCQLYCDTQTVNLRLTISTMLLRMQFLAQENFIGHKYLISAG